MLFFNRNKWQWNLLFWLIVFRLSSNQPEQLRRGWAGRSPDSSHRARFHSGSRSPALTGVHRRSAPAGPVSSLTRRRHVLSNPLALIVSGSSTSLNFKLQLFSMSRIQRSTLVNSFKLIYVSKVPTGSLSFKSFSSLSIPITPRPGWNFQKEDYKAPRAVKFFNPIWVLSYLSSRKCAPKGVLPVELQVRNWQGKKQVQISRRTSPSLVSNIRDFLTSFIESCRLLVHVKSVYNPLPVDSQIKITWICCQRAPF